MSEDYWTAHPNSSVKNQHGSVETQVAQSLLSHLDGVQALDSGQEITVPPVLCPWALDRIDGEAAALYAVIDATDFVGLEERLITSGLEHRCLFVGDAFTDLRDQAPWLVRLDPDNRFTAHMFSDGKASWLLWQHEAHIFVRSHAPLGDVWSHLRRVLRFRDDKQRWQMFRFWQQDFMRFCGEALEHDTDTLGQLFGGGLLRSIFGLNPAGNGWHLANPAPADAKVVSVIKLGQAILPLARRYAWLRFQVALFENLDRRYDGKGPDMRRTDVILVSDEMRNNGIVKENAVADLTEAALVAKHYELDFRQLEHSADPMQQLSEATRAKRVKMAVNEAAAELRHG